MKVYQMSSEERKKIGLAGQKKIKNGEEAKNVE